MATPTSCPILCLDGEEESGWVERGGCKMARGKGINFGVAGEHQEGPPASPSRCGQDEEEEEGWGQEGFAGGSHWQLGQAAAPGPVPTVMPLTVTLGHRGCDKAELG